jgi:hypothetical protein
LADEMVIIERIRAAKEITVVMLEKALIPFSEEEFADPKRLATKVGTVFAVIYNAVKNPGVYLDDQQGGVPIKRKPS